MKLRRQDSSDHVLSNGGARASRAMRRPDSEAAGNRAEAAADQPAPGDWGRGSRVARQAGFTLAEVLAALLFLAIVIPTAVEALHVASLAGEVAARKSEAARVANRVLNESIVTTNWLNGVQSGTVTEGILAFRWRLTAQSWPQDSMQLLTAEVTYSAQGKDYSVHLSTLANYQTLAVPAGVGSPQQ